MSKAILVKIVTLLVLVVASQMTAACSRIVSVEPLLADIPASQARWDGAYVGTMDEGEKRALPMLLQVDPRRDGSYEFTIHSRGIGHDIFSGSEPLELVGRGELRIADLGDGYVVAQTRCEIGAPSRGTELDDKLDAMRSFLTAARRMGALSSKQPQSKYLGPYLYMLVRGGPSRPEAIMGLDGTAAIREAAQGSTIDIDKWEGGVGEGLLAGAGLLFEQEDIHLSNHGAPGSAKPFFAKLARKVFSEYEIKNAMVWTRIERKRLQGLSMDDSYAQSDRTAAWCNLMLARPSESHAESDE